MTAPGGEHSWDFVPGSEAWLCSREGAVIGPCTVERLWWDGWWYDEEPIYLADVLVPGQGRVCFSFPVDLEYGMLCPMEHMARQYAIVAATEPSEWLERLEWWG